MTDVDIAVLIVNLAGGGAERVCLNLVNAFVARGLRVDLVLLDAKGVLLPLVDPRVRVVDLAAPRIRQAAVPLARYLRDTRPRAMLANVWPLTTMAVAAGAAVGSGTRIVTVEHTTWSLDERSQLRRNRWPLVVTLHALAGRADARVAVSAGAADDLAAVSGVARSRIHVIHNPIVGGVRPDAASELPSAWAEGSHRRILAVGALKPAKDYPTLLRAFATLRAHVDARLLVVGEGGERERLVALTRELGVAEHVDFAGYLPSPAAAYARAHLHVLSSAREGFANVLVEALEQGTPVVSTDCRSGPREILEDGRYGTLVPVGDDVALAASMERALDAPVDRAALQARAACFSVDRAVDAYLELLLPSATG